MSLGIEPYALGPEKVPGSVAQLPDGILEFSRPVEHLNAKIHRVHDHQMVAAQTQFRRIVELSVARARTADLLHEPALHVEHPDLLAKGIRDVDLPRCGIDGDPRGPLEVPLALEA